MKIKISFFTLCFVFFLLQAGMSQMSAKIYASSNLAAIIPKHKSIAILPLAVMMRDTRKKKNRASVEELATEAKQYQKDFQNSMFSSFLKMKKKKKMLNLSIQDVDKTNTLLKKNGIKSNEELEDFTKDEIAKLLGVDAVFGGNVTTSSSLSSGGAALVGLFTTLSVKTGDADVFIKLWHGEDGELIWSFSRKVNSSASHSVDDMVDYLMKRVSKRFPYRLK